MEFDYVKDKIFDFLNEERGIGIADINTDERKNIYTLSFYNGETMEIEFRIPGMQKV